MVSHSRKKIGLIGFGQIGNSLYQEIQNNQDLGMEVTFIYEANPDAAENIPARLRLPSMNDFSTYKPDLGVEAAHPDAVHQYAETVLQTSDLMIMSVSALGDSDLEARLRTCCQENATRLFIPHGAVLGLDGLKDGLSIWEQVTITMIKNPRNLNFEKAPNIRQEDITQKTVLYDGPTRDILPSYPKNVNSHATLALATLGLDRTRSVLIADPEQEDSVITIEAIGGGNRIFIERKNPIKGVTGKLTILSVMETLKSIFGEQKEIIVV
jgi:predicted dinucleotide-utilizing enzyme